MRKFTQLIIAAIIGSGFTVAAVYWYQKDQPRVVIQRMSSPPVTSVGYQNGEGDNALLVDFTVAAEKANPAVVYVQSSSLKLEEAKGDRFNRPFHHFFYDPSNPTMKKESLGSGVIITQDGYIVTNHHVVRGANEVRITLGDNRTFDAKIVGTDEDTDIALLKIEAENLPYLSFVDSDKAKVGQWVLAVGNPLNLNSTVTAGIISAKGRNINIIENGNRGRVPSLGSTAIESFIQTDAAINRGNSGGALVDMEGRLLGINTAIASPTGSYSGYGFAIPSNLVSKVVEDLIAYGTVQRGWLGVTIQSVNTGLVEEENLAVREGAYITGFADNSAAKEAGLQKGDIIVELDGMPVKSNVALIEYIGTKRPKDKVSVTINRKGKKMTVSVTLKNKNGDFEIIKRSEVEEESGAFLGLQLQEMSSKELQKLNLRNGVRVSDLEDGKLVDYTDMEPGFIITHIDNKPVSSIQDVKKILINKDKGDLVVFSGIYRSSSREYIYAIRI